MPIQISRMSDSGRCVSSSNVSFTVEVIDAKMIEKISSNVFFCYQVHTLLKGLEKIVASVDMPMLVCGDFNSIPSRSILGDSFCKVYLLVSERMVECYMFIKMCILQGQNRAIVLSFNNVIWIVFQCPSCSSCNGKI